MRDLDAVRCAMPDGSVLGWHCSATRGALDVRLPRGIVARLTSTGPQDRSGQTDMSITLRACGGLSVAEVVWALRALSSDAPREGRRERGRRSPVVALVTRAIGGGGRER